MERQAIKVTEAAKALGVSRISLYRAIKNGELHTIKIGKMMLVPTSEIDRLLNKESAA